MIPTFPTATAERAGARPRHGPHPSHLSSARLSQHLPAGWQGCRVPAVPTGAASLVSIVPAWLGSHRQLGLICTIMPHRAWLPFHPPEYKSGSSGPPPPTCTTPSPPPPPPSSSHQQCSHSCRRGKRERENPIFDKLAVRNIVTNLTL